MSPILEGIIIGCGLVVFAILVGLCVCVAALGAHMWANAVAATHRARAHGAEADSTQATIQSATDALEEADEYRPRGDYRPPSDRDLYEQILSEREPEYTTTTNEGIEEQAPIPEGGFYKPPAEFQ